MFFFFFVFLWPHPQPMDSQARRQIRAVAAGLCQSQQHQIQASCATHTITHGNARSLTHWGARPGIEHASSWMLVRFVSTEPQWELPKLYFSFLIFISLYSMGPLCMPHCFVLSFCHFATSGATPMAYRGSQARDLIRAVAASLRHSHSNMCSELCLQPTPQPTAMLDP